MGLCDLPCDCDAVDILCNYCTTTVSICLLLVRGLSRDDMEIRLSKQCSSCSCSSSTPCPVKNEASSFSTISFPFLDQFS